MEQMQVLRQKISMPVPPSIILHRETLAQSLIDAIVPHDASSPAPHKLALLYAPAGYGKTTLLLDVVQQCSTVCCWYILDETDADPGVFLTRLWASIQRTFPALATQSAPRLDEHAPSSASGTGANADQLHFVDELVERLKKENAEHFVLVLCNYHEVNHNEAINRLVNRLLARLPERGVLVIESRSMPNLMLASLIARRQMFALGYLALRFTAQELYELAHLQNINTFSLQEAGQLASMFEGWIAGILLGSRLGYALFHPAAPSQTGQASASIPLDGHMHIMAYIQEEVFKHETATYEFLSRTSILERLTPEYCNALLEIDDAAVRMIHAEQCGLFITRNRENVSATASAEYICHPALRQLFVERLQREALDDYYQLHLRAAHILHNDQQYEQAIMHACSARQYRLAADIIVERAAAIIYEEHGDMLLRWLDMLPEDIFKQYPRLLLIAANIHLRHGEFARVPPLLDTADALVTSLAGGEDGRAVEILQAELAVARAHLCFFQGEFLQTQSLCQQALTLLSTDERKLRIRAFQYLGVSMIVGTGQVQEGITQLHRALQMSRSQENERQVATLHRLVANGYGWIGNHVLAEYHQSRAFQIWEQVNNSRGMIYCLTSLGLLKMRQGFTDQAEELLRRALQQSRDPLQFKSGEAYALVALGDLYNSLGRYTEALTFLEDGLSLARACEDRYLICCALCYLALPYVFLGDAQTAHFFLQQVALKQGETHSFEGCLYGLTRGTIYLAQQDYKQAEPMLESATETSLHTNIQIIYISALLRLAICYLRQGKRTAAMQTGQRIIDLNKKGDFDFFLRVEFRRYPELHAFLETVSEMTPAEDETAAVETPSQTPPASSEKTLTPVEREQAKSSMQIYALGEPKVVIDGITVTRWRMARAMELFFFLLEVGHPVRKGSIIVTLWPEHDGEQVDSTFRTTIYYLRKALGDSILLFQAGLYSLNLPQPAERSIWYDVQIFNEYYNTAKKALANEDDTTAATALDNMLHVYNGDYVQSFYNNWCILRRGELRQEFMDAHHQLALIAWRRKDWDDSLQHWQRLLVIDPCYEAAHYGIMRCYLQQGKREQALRQFQSCSQTLREELQATPRASLQKLYQSIIKEE